MNTKNKKILIISLAALVILCAAAFLALRLMPTGTVAVIRVNGELYDKIDLSRVKESYELEIKTSFGTNTLLVEPGAISVISASCPDKVCIKQGRLSRGGVPIVCLPNRLSITIEGGGTDA